MLSSCPKISVIIPVYNTVEYLKECFDSVLSQSIQDIEVVVVDDGSSDGSWDIIEEYAAAYPQFKVYKQSRKRQGAARNHGLCYATGEYIAFLDSDDTLPIQAYSRLYDSAERFKSDMVLGPYQSFFYDRKWFEQPLHKQLLSGALEQTDIFSYPALLEDISVCNRIIRREFLEKYQLRFPERYAGEDVFFMTHVYLKCKKISIVPHVVYNCRRKRKASSSFRISLEFFQNRKDTAMELTAVFDENSATQLHLHLLRSEVRKLVGSRLARVVKELPGHEQQKVFEVLREMTSGLSFQDIYQDNYFNAVHRLCVRMLQEGEFAALSSFEESRTKISFLRVIRSKKLRFELAKLIPPLYLLGCIRMFKKLAHS